MLNGQKNPNKEKLKAKRLLHQNCIFSGKDSFASSIET